LGLGAAGYAGTKLSQKAFGDGKKKNKKNTKNPKTGKICPESKTKTYGQ
jgi:hypothetical protein